MKKIFLILSLTIATNIFSDVYFVCDGSLREVKKCGQKMMSSNFIPSGSITPYVVTGGNYRYIQSFYFVSK